ncbi:VOC family protein [Exilibacterium tricleocarpae]|uniref:VOC family protein n=1 Tax=Exilibacterium tricleocarpae TaxID=2591008 RepID=A0A545U8E1_9GAMM|nr:VOC family protein [Exilibacterium tricleocarpae]TQV85745.1 VOC family protein [Exilibacterium tricleocarpae]
MFEIAAIDHIVLRTSRREQMLQFYCGVLGCRVERETAPETGLTQLRAGNALIDIVTIDSDLGRRGGPAPAADGNNLDHFCLQLKPVAEQAMREYLQTHGIEAGEFKRRYGAQGFGPSLYIRDPEGNTVELKSQLPPEDGDGGSGN